MKKNIFILLFLPAILFCSCDSFLSPKPSDFVSQDNYFNNEAELNTALAGVYDALSQDGTFSRNLVMELAHSSDEGFYKRNNSDITPYFYNHDASHAIINACWRQLYDGVNRANLLLANVDKPVMDERKRKAIKGEALFLRAFMYFQLVNNWGDVPLLLEPTLSSETVNIPRKPSVDILRQIETDMKAADSLVYEITDIGFGGRVSRSAVQGILARVYLKWAGYPLQDVSKFAEAKKWALKVVDSDIHSLNDDFKQVFINHSSDRYDIKESIWEIEFYGNSSSGTEREGSRFAIQFAVKNTNEEVGYAYGVLGATGRLFKKYTDVNDVRRDWTIAPFSFKDNETEIKVDKAETDIYTREVGKWRREYEPVRPLGKDWGQTNFPVLRYADVLLMLAEAENEINGPEDALQYLNEVRKRAHAFEYTGVNTITDQTEFRDVIRDERARELAFEALRKFDLIRWGIFLREMTATGNDQKQNAPSSVAYSTKAYTNVRQKHVLLPIPSLELALNKSMTQNSGW